MRSRPTWPRVSVCRRRPDLAKFYRDYARRRFGEEAADTLAESLTQPL